MLLTADTQTLAHGDNYHATFLYQLNRLIVHNMLYFSFLFLGKQTTQASHMTNLDVRWMLPVQETVVKVQSSFLTKQSHCRFCNNMLISSLLQEPRVLLLQSFATHSQISDKKRSGLVGRVKRVGQHLT